jgi:hypothetical protein
MKNIYNDDQIYLNDVVMKEERMEEKSEIQPNLQTKESINTNEGEKRNKENFLKLHLQINKWRHDNKNALCWSFYCVNEKKLMDVK